MLRSWLNIMTRDGLPRNMNAVESLTETYWGRQRHIHTEGTRNKVRNFGPGLFSCLFCSFSCVGSGCARRFS